MIATEEDAGRLMTTAVTRWLKPLADSTVLVTSAVYGALLLSVRTGLFGAWLLILLGLPLWRYAYAVLSRVEPGSSRSATRQRHWRCCFGVGMPVPHRTSRRRHSAS